MRYVGCERSSRLRIKNKKLNIQLILHVQEKANKKSVKKCQILSKMKEK